jgi:hypothetical protein
MIRQITGYRDGAENHNAIACDINDDPAQHADLGNTDNSKHYRRLELLSVSAAQMTLALAFRF